MAWYRAGTVGVTNGSTTVVLTGGDAQANIFPGDTFKGPDGKDYEVAGVASSSQFTLATNYEGTTATAQPYAIQPTASTGTLRLLLGQVSDLVTNYQAGRDAWMSTASSTLKGRKSAGPGAAEDLTASDVLAILTSGSPSPLTGSELLPALQGAGAVKVTPDQLLSRAAGRVLPFEIGGARIATLTANGLGIGITAPERGIHVRGGTTAAASIRAQGVGAGVEPSFEMHSPSGHVFSLGGISGGGMTFTQVGVGQRAAFRYNGDFTFGPTHINVNTGSNTIAGCGFAPYGTAHLARESTGPKLLIQTLNQDVLSTAVQFYSNQTPVGSITTTSSSTAYNTSSDYRLKGEFAEIDPLSAIERVKQLRPGRFPWLATGEVVDGFLAHEAQAVVPEAVTGEKDEVEEIGDATGYRERDPETGVPILGTQETLTGITQAECPNGYEWAKTGERPVYQGIDQSKLVPLLAAGLKAAIGEIEDLRTRIAALESAA